MLCVHVYIHLSLPLSLYILYIHIHREREIDRYRCRIIHRPVVTAKTWRAQRALQADTTTASNVYRYTYIHNIYIYIYIYIYIHTYTYTYTYSIAYYIGLRVGTCSSRRVFETCRYLFVSSDILRRTVSFHNFKSQNFKLSVPNPKSKYVAYLSVLSHISNCQGLGRKHKHEIMKTDRTTASIL